MMCRCSCLWTARSRLHINIRYSSLIHPLPPLFSPVIHSHLFMSTHPLSSDQQNPIGGGLLHSQPTRSWSSTAPLSLCFANHARVSCLRRKSIGASLEPPSPQRALQTLSASLNARNTSAFFVFYQITCCGRKCQPLLYLDILGRSMSNILFISNPIVGFALLGALFSANTYYATMALLGTTRYADL